MDQNYSIKIKNWDGLICLSNPDIDLYIDPLDMSGIKLKNNIKDEWLFNDLSLHEINYLKSNKKKIINFTNKFQSYLSHSNKIKIVDVAFEFSLPVNFIIKYFKKLEGKKFISLSHED